MSFFNDAQRDGLLTGRYICSECGGLMEFEDEWEDTLVCPGLRSLRRFRALRYGER